MLLLTDNRFRILLLLVLHFSWSGRLKRSFPIPRDVTFDQFGIPKYEDSPLTDYNRGVSNKIVPSPVHERGVNRKYQHLISTNHYGSQHGQSQQQSRSYSQDQNSGPSYASQSGACYCPCAAGFAGSVNPVRKTYPSVTQHQPPSYQNSGNRPSESGHSQPSYSNNQTPPPGFIPALRPQGQQTYSQIPASPRPGPSYDDQSSSVPPSSYNSPNPSPQPSYKQHISSPQSRTPSYGQPRVTPAKSYGDVAPPPYGHASPPSQSYPSSQSTAPVFQPYPKPEPPISQVNYLQPPTYLIQQPIPPKTGYGNVSQRKSPGYGNEQQPQNQGYSNQPQPVARGYGGNQPPANNAYGNLFSNNLLSNGRRNLHSPWTGIN